jgi:hypothetical protein
MKEVYDAAHPRADVATVGVGPGGMIPHPAAGVPTSGAHGSSRPLYPAKAG